MIDSLTTYVRTEVFPRYHRILFTSHIWIAAVGGLLFSRGYFEFEKDVKLSTLVSYIATYSSLAIGFCVTAMTVCFALSEKYIKFLNKSKDKDSNKDALDDLVFVFSWTAITNVVEIIYAVFLNIIVGDVRLSQWVLTGFSVRIFFLVFIMIYSFLQFLVAVISISQAVTLYKMLIIAEKK